MAGPAFWNPPHSGMYEPPDFSVLPTSNDVLHAKDVIQQMGDSLMNAMFAPGRVTEHLAVLRAWIAPVRRLNDDVLSIIFEFCGEDHAKNTLRISAVSRGWRQAILATPRAWAYLDIYRCRHHPTVQLFLERSRPYPLHARFHLSGPFSLTSDVLNRIVCLSLRYAPHMRAGVTFPNVTRLCIYALRCYIRLSELKTTIFPALRHLFCTGVIRDDDVGEFTLPSGIAPLETLSLVVVNDPTCLRVLQSCRRSLVSLQIVQYEPCSGLSPRLQVVFPLLKHLEIQNWAGTRNKWPIDWKTPVLETYWQRFGDEGSPRHHDLSTVKQLCMDRRLEFPSLPKLKLLRARHKSGILHYLRLISSDPTIFPELERIELEMEGNVSNEVLLAATTANAERLRPILLLARDKYSPLNGTIATQICNWDMPCRFEP